MKNNNIKVISVGNLVMGGAGKTPHTIAIAKKYATCEKVAVISLGYKGGIGYGINVVSDGEKIYLHPPAAADEPYMIALNCPSAVVITGKKREESIALARDKFGCTLAILDDGFQYRKLERDANILLLDHKNPISTGFPFPFGYLREPPSAASKADMIIFTRATSSTIPEKAKKYIKNKPVFFSKTVMKKIVFNGEEVSAEIFKNKKTAAFSAVASNKSFHRSLLELELDITHFNGYHDHHLLTDNAVEKIIRKGGDSGAELFITTEKDFVKLSQKYQKIFGYLKMEIEIENSESFFQTLNNFLT